MGWGSEQMRAISRSKVVRHHETVELRQVRLSDCDVECLLVGLAGEYERRYGPGDEMTTASVDDFELPNGIFLILVDDGETVAGGGVRRWSPETCEVKRVWTAPHHRRRGYASAVLERLERAARDLGYAYIRAETGPAQPEAVSLYRGCGYREIPAYGPYEDATAFEKVLTVAE